ncbi:hypothetical protein ACFY00_19825 [Kitasatospora sp. NPDC001540]|uniref:hypothetical protein n=1 Tax=Kitasatospora sp. NPDC001540 TaxID=3364014 RepID=UPI0036A75C00
MPKQPSTTPLDKYSAVGGPFAGLTYWQLLLTFLPLGLALVLVLGAVGAALGAGAAMANLKVVRKELSTPVKALAMLGVDLAAAALWLAVAGAVGAATTH